MHFDDDSLCFGRDKPDVSVGIHRGTCRNSSDKTDTFTQNIKGCCCLPSGFEVDPDTKDVLDTMLFKSKLEGQVSLDRHTSHLLAFRSCCQYDKIHCCGLLTKSCGDQGGRECASSRILNGAFFDSALHHPTQLENRFSVSISRFFLIRFVLAHKMPSPRPVHFASR